MPYGHPSSSGHGHRPTRYRWAPSFDPASLRRKPRRATARTARQRRTRSALPSLNWEEAFAPAPGGHGVPNWYFSLVGSLILLALAIHFPALLVLGVLRWVMGGADTCAEEAEKSMLSYMDKTTSAIRIKRKTSVDSPPDPEAVRQAWEASRRSLAGKLLAGTLLSNLEPVVDQSYIRDEDGTVVGRRPGIKGWLAVNCPDMLPHYKALMSYKALADKLCMALGVEEPDTLSSVLDMAETMAATDANDSQKGVERRGCSPKSLHIKNDVKLLKSNVESVIERVRKINEIMARMGSTGSMKALEAAVRERLGLVWMRRGRRWRRAA